jgi:hypothetical protein
MTRTFNSIYAYSFALISLFMAMSCSSDDPNFDYLNAAQIPSNLSLIVTPTTDNSGNVIFTPSALSASKFNLDFGDGSEPVSVVPGTNAVHAYQEGSFTATLVAENINGETSQPLEQAVVVSFLAPENLEITVLPVAGDNFSISVSATATLAAGFEVYFGDQVDETPTPLMIAESVTHTYAETGTYELTVVALSGGSQTLEGTITVEIDNPVLLPLDFEDETLEYVFFDFGGAVNTRIANPDPSGINTSANVVEFFKEADALVYAGTAIPLGENIDFSLGSTVSMDVWSPIAGTTVKLKIENAANPNIAMEVDAFPSVANQWETLYFDFSGFDLSQEYAKIVVFFDFGNTGNDDTFYYDNIAQGTLPGAVVELPLDFENTAVPYEVFGFEGANSNIDVNPDPTGINTSSRVVRTVKGVDAVFYAGTAVPLQVPIVFDATEKIKMKVWSPKADIPVRLKLENSNGDFVELDTNTTTSNAWEELVWDFAGQNTAPEFATVVVFFEFIVDLPGDGSTYYFDDIDYAN